MIKYMIFSFVTDGSLRWQAFSLSRLLSLGFVVISVTMASFGPLILLVSLEEDHWTAVLVMFHAQSDHLAIKGFQRD